MMYSTSVRAKLVDEDEPPAKSKTVRPSSEELPTNEVTDFVIANEGQEYPVHKSVLSRHSDYFKALLEGTTCMRESQTNRISLQGISEQAIKAVVKYMYEGTVDISLSNLDDLLNAASHLQIHPLITQCSHWFSECFEVEHYRDFVETARKYCLPESLTGLNKQLAKHFLKLTDNRNLFFELEADQLIDVVSQDCLQVRSERELLSLLELWLSKFNDLNGRNSPCSKTEEEEDAIVAKLLSNVRFCLISLSDLRELNLSSHYPSEVNLLIHSAISYHEDFSAITSTVQNQIRSSESSLVVVLATGVNKKHEILACRHQGDATEVYSLYSDAAHQKTCAAVTVHNRLYTITLEHYGGFDHDSIVRLRCFDPCVEDQIPLPCPELQALPAGITAVGNMIYLCGGVSKCHTTFTNLCEAFDVNNLKWERVASLPAALTNSAAAGADGKVYLSGGQRMQQSNRIVSGKFFSLKPGDAEWNELASMNVARRGHSLLAVGDEALIACGGLIKPVAGVSGTGVAIERYDIATDQWTEIRGCSTLRGPSLGHFILLPHEPSKLYTLGHELQRAQEHEVWCTDLEDTESASENSSVHMTLPEKFKLHDAFAAHLYLNFNDKRLLAKRSF